MPLPQEDRRAAADASCVRDDFTLPALDGFPLSARLWSSRSLVEPRFVAIINAGAGIAFHYYDRFAAYLAETGIPTVLYDYRGIASSRPPSLVGFHASVQDWGSKDCAAVLDWVSQHFPRAKRILVGHSVGGFVTGFAANGDRIDRMLLIGAHTGYWGDYARGARIPMFLLWHALMPTITGILGYFPGRRLRLLEDLPKDAALDWARRYRPDFWWYLKRPDGMPDQDLIDSLLSHFHAIRAETLALRFDDDPFATEAATDRILALYANAPASRVNFGPCDVASERIGHFGFFRSRFRSTLWSQVTNWIETDG